MDRVRNKRDVVTRGSIKEYFRNDVLDFWVPFESQGSSLNVAEMSKDGLSRQVSGSATLYRGVIGTGALFGTTTQTEAYVSATCNYEWNQPFSGIVWATHNVTNRYDQIVAHGQASAPYRGWFFFKSVDADRNNVLAFQLINNASPGTAYINVYGSTFLKDAKLHCLGFSYNGSGQASGVRLFVDGQPETNAIILNNLGGATIIAGVVMAIGNRDTPATNNQAWDGSIEEVGILKRNLDPVEHALYYEWAKPRYV